MSKRQKSSTEFIFGLHAVNALIQHSPQQLIKLYVLQGRLDKPMQILISLAEELDIAIEYLSRNDLNKLAPEQNHQGIIANCRAAVQYTEADLEALLAGLTVPPLLLILDGVQDPHNLGACLRTADAAGVHIVIAPKDQSVGLTPAVRKVACGAAENVPFIQVTNLARTLRLLKDQGIWLFGAAGEAGATHLYQTKLAGAIGIVMGAEGSGLRRLTRELCDALIAIPMFGSVTSLNVSVATGICLYEVVRQRGKN